MTVLLKVGRELGCGREHREAARREPGAPLPEGRFQWGNPPGAPHLRYEGRDLAQQVARAPQLVGQVRVPDVRGA